MPELLRSLGIDVVADLPGVGANLQDHLEVYVQFANKLPASPSIRASRGSQRLGVGAQWLFLRKGIGATNHFEGGGFCRSNDDVDYPNLMFHFLPMAIRYDGTLPALGPGLPGARRADVFRRARLGADPLRRSDGNARPCSSTICRRTRTGANGSRRFASRAAS